MFDLCIDQYIFDKPDNRAMLMMMTFIVIRVVKNQGDDEEWDNWTANVSLTSSQASKLR